MEGLAGVAIRQPLVRRRGGGGDGRRDIALVTVGVRRRGGDGVTAEGWGRRIIQWRGGGGGERGGW